MTTQQRTKTVLTLAAVAMATLALTTTPASAAITIDSTFAAGATGGATGTYTFPSFDASASDKLVVVVGSRRDRGATHSINSVTYGGVAMIEAVEQRSGNTVEESTAVYYLDNPGAAGPVVVASMRRAGLPIAAYPYWHSRARRPAWQRPPVPSAHQQVWTRSSTTRL